MKTRLIIAGACGRMGKLLLGAALSVKNAELVGALERKGHPNLGMDAGVCAGLGKTGCVVADSMEKLPLEGSVLIDFTTPEATVENIKQIAGKKAKAVIGTTGLSASQINELLKAAKKTAIVFSPNMGVGMNVLFKLCKDVAGVLGDDYDAEIIEAHHRFKKDSPSGSAMRLAQNLADGFKRDLEKAAVYGRKGLVGERKSGEIGIHAVRAGDIVGDHTVLFANLGERLELRHQAHSREPFARGAVRAALWVSSQKPGLYDMQDVLGLK